MARPVVSATKPGAARSWLLWVVITAELVLGLFCVGITAFLLVRASALEPPIANGKRMAAAIVGTVALIVLSSVVGLFRRVRAGWWTAFMSNVALATVLFWDAFSENYFDISEIIAGAIFAVLTALLLVRPVRREAG